MCIPRMLQLPGILPCGNHCACVWPSRLRDRSITLWPGYRRQHATYGWRWTRGGRAVMPFHVAKGNAQAPQYWHSPERQATRSGARFGSAHPMPRAVVKARRARFPSPPAPPNGVQTAARRARFFPLHSMTRLVKWKAIDNPAHAAYNIYCYQARIDLYIVCPPFLTRKWV